MEDTIGLVKVNSLNAFKYIFSSSQTTENIVQTTMETISAKQAKLQEYAIATNDVDTVNVGIINTDTHSTSNSKEQESVELSTENTSEDNSRVIVAQILLAKEILETLCFWC